MEGTCVCGPLPVLVNKRSRTRINVVFINLELTLVAEDGLKMAANYSVPPKFDEARPYECWNNEVNIWRRVTELDIRKQALAVALGLEGRAKEIAMEIPAEDLDNDNGMDTLFMKLDGVFEEKGCAYDVYSHVDRLMKDSSVSMVDYIIDFEQRYNRMKKYNMALPDAVLAFKLLDTTCLDEKKQTACTDGMP